MGALDELVAITLPVLPRHLVGLVARRYIAGDTVQSALDCVAGLNESGASCTLDVLGEDTTSLEQAARTRDAYVALLGAVSERGLRSTVSVKLTALGLKQDAATCKKNLAAICEAAREHDNYVRIDMEDSSCTDATLDLYEELRGDFDNVGPVLQAYLRRTLDDARRVAGGGTSVRLCKGIYREPWDIAWNNAELVRRNYIWVLRELFSQGCHVGIATHDEVLAWEALRLIDELDVPKERYEFQMLLGVTEELRAQLISAGHDMRIYVPFGEKWYEYSLRRLRENPEIAGHVTRATISRFLPSRRPRRHGAP